MGEAIAAAFRKIAKSLAKQAAKRTVERAARGLADTCTDNAEKPKKKHGTLLFSGIVVGISTILIVISIPLVILLFLIIGIGAIISSLFQSEQSGFAMQTAKYWGMYQSAYEGDASTASSEEQMIFLFENYPDYYADVKPYISFDAETMVAIIQTSKGKTADTFIRTGQTVNAQTEVYSFGEGTSSKDVSIGKAYYEKVPVLAAANNTVVPWQAVYSLLVGIYGDHSGELGIKQHIDPDVIVSFAKALQTSVTLTDKSVYNRDYAWSEFEGIPYTVIYKKTVQSNELKEFQLRKGVSEERASYDKYALIMRCPVTTDIEQVTSYREISTYSYDTSGKLQNVAVVADNTRVREALEKVSTTYGLTEFNLDTLDSDAALQGCVKLPNGYNEAVILHGVIGGKIPQTGIDMDVLNGVLSIMTNKDKETNSANVSLYVKNSFCLPIDPETCHVTSECVRWRSFDNNKHCGMDFGTYGKTPPLYACWDGKVVCARFSSSAGNWVQIEHTDETTSKVYTATYMHLTEYYVAEGDTVSKGDCIGIVGKTGCSQGEHLHFQINRGAYNSTKLDNIINPRFFIGDALGPVKEDEHSYLIMY